MFAVLEKVCMFLTDVLNRIVEFDVVEDQEVG
jgi:hypothetical protein